MAQGGPLYDTNFTFSPVLQCFCFKGLSQIFSKAISKFSGMHEFTL